MYKLLELVYSLRRYSKNKMEHIFLRHSVYVTIRCAIYISSHTKLTAYRFSVQDGRNLNITRKKNKAMRLVPWLSGRTLVFDRRAFAVLRST